MVDSDAVRRGYDALRETYAAERSADGREREIIESFLESLSEPARVLDAGCGQGTPVLHRGRESMSIVGVDFSRGQLELAATAVSEEPLVQGDLTALPVGDAAVDAVTALHSVIHVPLEEHRTVVDEFARVLRPGGRVLVSEGPDEWRGSNPDWLDSGVEMQWHVAGADATRDQLRAAGFAIDREWTAADESAWVFVSATLEGS
ncbi:class I SAM-dependent methyltransferase [Haloterrigena alkaliphila]|uniref:Class I SAM-dependent methyltransferase n=1 Tax=Haloterrigena alkaliphila TaxID=2816475 RepID=A0A8A2VMK0_9EURY|nr:class I SAM-dependent methyltransferase [Haloterrigena alkaliphila]QSW99378.1 class I SAM-dependent methyltransferase [Haloterrigena alkaliphila]